MQHPRAKSARHDLSNNPTQQEPEEVIGQPQLSAHTDRYALKVDLPIPNRRADLSRLISARKQHDLSARPSMKDALERRLSQGIHPEIARVERGA